MGSMATLCVRCESPLPEGLPPRICASCKAEYPLLDGAIEALIDGREYPGRAPGGSWDPAYYAVLDPLLDGHPWYVGRNRAILAFLRRHAPDVLTGPALDLGCGGGFVTAWLAQNGVDVRGADILLEGLRLARRRTTAPLALFAPGRLPYVEQFDLVVLADVIEHADDDIGLLAEARRALRPGGAVLVTVPAFSWLWGRIDDAAYHRRRYTVSGLRAALRHADFAVQAASYYMMPLVPVIFLRRSSPRGDLADTFLECSTPPGRILSAVLSLYLRLEEWWLGRGTIPIGSSLLAIARKTPCSAGS